MSKYEFCKLCGRMCGVDRTNGALGYCGMPNEAYVARIGLHRWEEPIISGKGGSGTIFFSGCSLGCVFCQNREISRKITGQKMSAREIAENMLSLQKLGAENINFVTPTHYAETLVESVSSARENGLSIPTLYNTSSYDTKDTIRYVKDSVDIFLPDFKYYLNKTATKYSNASNYIETAKAAIDEMVSARPEPIIENGIMKKGVIVRILLLPSHVAEAKLILEYLYKSYGDSIYISLMSQYTPIENMKSPLDRRVTKREYLDLVSYGEKLGIKNAFTQDISSSNKDYIPDFLN